jgi:biopolymer transport protein ExbD
MRIRKSSGSNILELDMTPMIDMTFQLIAFFMLAVNFTQSEQHESIVLPTASLARPADRPLEAPITLHVTKTGNVIVAGQDQEIPLIGLKPHLVNEANALVARQKSPSDATIIIRAHRDVPTGKVQDVIRVCQENRFDQFVLRVREQLD